MNAYHPVLSYLRAYISYCALSGEDSSWARRLLAEGQDFPQMSVRKVPLGTPGNCFVNARKLSRNRKLRPPLRYVEGVVSHFWHQPGMERPEPWIVRHAWCVEPDLRVVDPTWPAHFTDRRYWGIILP